MNENNRNEFVLGSAGDEAPPVLVAVEVDGRLDGVLFTQVLRQTYRNDGERNLEVVYTFPLAHGAVLLGFAAELGGRRLEGEIVELTVGERTYEEALADGDTPVMLEMADGGLHTANIGNLKAGEQIVLEVRTAQTLAFEQGRLRLAIPTTVAPRFGRPAAAGLQPHQVPEASLAADYPLTLGITVAGDLASATIDCPTHPHRLTQTGQDQRLDLHPGASMDRDVVIVVTPAQAHQALLATAVDEVSESAPVVALAAFGMPTLPERERIALKLVVDCSGSMGGDSIASARLALLGVVAGLRSGDEVSLSRFGNQVDHVLRRTSVRPGGLDSLRDLIDQTDASMGGTEMNRALRSVFKAWVPEGGDGADVLLITDGEVWDTPELIAVAKRSGHRVFAIGVGSAPAQDVLRELAEATGGACEFATPGEALEAAAHRMLNRIRQRTVCDIGLDWGATPVWQLALPSNAFGGDTLLAMAGFAAGDAPVAARLLADGGAVELASAGPSVSCPGDAMARLMAARRHSPGMIADKAARLAVDYRLLTCLTRCVLVHKRAQQDKPAEAAQLHRVRSMLAAGWGASSSVRLASRSGIEFDIAEAGVCFSRKSGRRPRGQPRLDRLCRSASIRRRSSSVTERQTSRTSTRRCTRSWPPSSTTWRMADRCAGCRPASRHSTRPHPCARWCTNSLRCRSTRPRPGSCWPTGLRCATATTATRPRPQLCGHTSRPSMPRCAGVSGPSSTNDSVPARAARRAGPTTWHLAKDAKPGWPGRCRGSGPDGAGARTTSTCNHDEPPSRLLLRQPSGPPGPDAGRGPEAGRLLARGDARLHPVAVPARGDEPGELGSAPGRRRSHACVQDR